MHELLKCRLDGAKNRMNVKTHEKFVRTAYLALSGFEILQTNTPSRFTPAAELTKAQLP